MTMILCDVDGVLADFTGAACREISDILGREVLPNECGEWDIARNFDLTNKQALAFDRRVRRKGFCANLDLLPGAQNAVNDLQDLGFVYFVTSPWRGSSYWMPERTQWLHEHFAIPSSMIVHAEDKSVVSGEVIIDDNPGNVVVGERKLRVLVPNAANAQWRKYGRPPRNMLCAKSWPKILAAVRGVK